MLPALETWSLNYWTTRKVPWRTFINRCLGSTTGVSDSADLEWDPIFGSVANDTGSGTKL